MGTMAEKLQNVIAAKADIAAAIAEKDGTVPEKLSEYGNAIRALPDQEPPVTPLDAKRLYAATRDPLWPPMPEDLPEHTIVFLYPGDGEVNLSMTSEGQYRVEKKLCTCTDGVWSYETEFTYLYDSKATCTFPILDSSDAPSGCRLVTVSASKITGFSFTELSGGVMQGCVEVLYRLPNAKMQFEGMQDVMYITGLGKAGGTASTRLCTDCPSLVCFIGPDLQLLGSHIYSFTGCKNLMAVDTSFGKAGIMRYAFQGCEKLTAIPDHFFENASACDNMFEGCHSLRKVRVENLPARTIHCDSMFLDCYSLENVSFSGVFTPSSMIDAFSGCLSLKRLVFDLPNWGGVGFSVENCAFDRKGLVEMFKSLPTVTTPHTITLTGNPGVAGLTEEDRAVATEKNWTLVLS